MRAIRILQQTISLTLVFIHAKRIEAVFWAVQSLLKGGKLSLTALGRSGAETSAPKHAIKRMDRLLGNQKLHKQIPIFYKALASMIIGDIKRPLILVDWTDAGSEHIAIEASVPQDGRSLPIYNEVYPKKMDNNLTAKKHFLSELRHVLPPHCRPIMVSDAGFKNEWFSEVANMGWDFIGRIRGTAHVKEIAANTDWMPVKEIFKKATTKPINLGKWILARSNPRALRLVLVRKSVRQLNLDLRIRKKILHAMKGAIEPWLLATSLDDMDAKRIVSFYSKRMQIEETFRDAKNHRFGWSFKYARSYSSKRYEVLLLIASLGMYAVTLLGHVAEKNKIHWKYQANTIRTRRVLSLFFLGCQIVKLKENVSISVNEFQTGFMELRLKLPWIDPSVTSFFYEVGKMK